MGSLDYVIEASEPEPIVQPTQDLLLAGFEMTRVVGARARVPRRRNVRQQNRMNDYSAPRLNLQTKEGDWFRKDFGNVYQMDEKVRNTGLEWIGIY